ncbi:hypothetical protein [Mycolicibacterium fluoranthenivorans]|nr:hypothetical protein [Mycolicibacterium fluoranthenivorans]
MTNHGRPVAIIVSPARSKPRTFGQLPNLSVPAGFDDLLLADQLAAWD